MHHVTHEAMTSNRLIKRIILSECTCDENVKGTTHGASHLRAQDEETRNSALKSISDCLCVISGWRIRGFGEGRAEAKPRNRNDPPGSRRDVCLCALIPG